MTRKSWFGAVLVGAMISVSCGETSGVGPTFPSSRVANYEGAWKGSYIISGCTQSGAVALNNLCSAIGSTPSFSLTLSQDRRTVAGSFNLGSVQFPTTGGTIGNDDTLSLTSTNVSTDFVTVATLSLKRTDNALDGTISQRVTAGGLSGEASLVGLINSSGR